MDISEINKSKSNNTRPLMIVVVSIFSVFSFFAGFGNGFLSALAQLIACATLLPIAWKIGDLFCKFTMPDFLLSSGAVDTFSKKLFWKVGPQLLAVIISWLFIFIAVADFFQDSSKENEISNAKPMSLEIDNRTDYFKYDVNKESGFDTPEFLATAKMKPVILTDGTLIELIRFDPPYIKKSDDKNLKQYDFSDTKKIVAYVPTTCVNDLSNKNREIYERITLMPKSINPKDFEANSFINNSCKKMIDLSHYDVSGYACVIEVSGNTKDSKCKEIQEIIFSYSDKSGLKRSHELEHLHKEKLNPISSKNLKSEESSANLVDILDTPRRNFSKLEEATFSPSFDCNKAMYLQEKLVCSDAELSRLDVQMYKLYSHNKENSKDVESIKNDQIDWIKSFIRQCTDKECLVRAYKKRISDLT